MGIVTSASSVQNQDRCTEESTRQPPYKGTCQDLPEAGGSRPLALQIFGSLLATPFPDSGCGAGLGVPKAAPEHGRGYDTMVVASQRSLLLLQPVRWLVAGGLQRRKLEQGRAARAGPLERAPAVHAARSR